MERLIPWMLILVMKGIEGNELICSELDDDSIVADGDLTNICQIIKELKTEIEQECGCQNADASIEASQCTTVVTVFKQPTVVLDNSTTLAITSTPDMTMGGISNEPATNGRDSTPENEDVTTSSTSPTSGASSATSTTSTQETLSTSHETSIPITTRPYTTVPNAETAIDTTMNPVVTKTSINTFNSSAGSISSTSQEATESDTTTTTATYGTMQGASRSTSISATTISDAGGVPMTSTGTNIDELVTSTVQYIAFSENENASTDGGTSTDNATAEYMSTSHSEIANVRNSTLPHLHQGKTTSSKENTSVSFTVSEETETTILTTSTNATSLEIGESLDGTDFYNSTSTASSVTSSSHRSTSGYASMDYATTNPTDVNSTAADIQNETLSAAPVTSTERATSPSYLTVNALPNEQRTSTYRSKTQSVTSSDLSNSRPNTATMDSGTPPITTAISDSSTITVSPDLLGTAVTLDITERATSAMLSTEAAAPTTTPLSKPTVTIEATSQHSANVTRIGSTSPSTSANEIASTTSNRNAPGTRSTKEQNTTFSNAINTSATTDVVSTGNSYSTTTDFSTAYFGTAAEFYNSTTASGASGWCFWIEFRRKDAKITYQEAEQICENNGSFPAEVCDNITLNTVVENVRLIQQVVMAAEGTSHKLWLGNMIDPETISVHPSDDECMPKTASSDCYGVAIFVGSSSVTRESRRNCSLTTSGVICQTSNKTYCSSQAETRSWSWSSNTFQTPSSTIP